MEVVKEMLDYLPVVKYMCKGCVWRFKVDDIMLSANDLYWIPIEEQSENIGLAIPGFYCKECLLEWEMDPDAFDITLMRVLVQLHMLEGVPDEMRPFQITEYQSQETPDVNFVISRLHSQSNTWDWGIEGGTVAKFSDVEYDSAEAAQSAMIDWFVNHVTQKGKTQ